MSALGRAFLRLATCAALRGRTLVGDEVYDSRIAALDPETFAPNIGDIAGSIGVYTEQDSGEALSRQNGGPLFRPQIELVIEIAFQARVTGGDGDAYEIAYPETDDELELSLDIIEEQVRQALFPPAMHPLDPTEARGFYKLTNRVEAYSSIRFTNPQAADKRAIRYLTYRVEISDQTLPIFDRGFTDDPAQPLLRLPPLWREVAALWPQDSVEATKAGLIARLLLPPQQTPLAGFDITATPGSPGDSPNPVTATVDTEQ